MFHDASSIWGCTAPIGRMIGECWIEEYLVESYDGLTEVSSRDLQESKGEEHKLSEKSRCFGWDLNQVFLV
jgi:hypothetical protein